MNRDYPVVFANLYIFALVGLVVNLISDLTYMWIDPRIDFEIAGDLRWTEASPRKHQQRRRIASRGGFAIRQAPLHPVGR